MIRNWKKLIIITVVCMSSVAAIAACRFCSKKTDNTHVAGYLLGILPCYAVCPDATGCDHNTRTKLCFPTDTLVAINCHYEDEECERAFPDTVFNYHQCRDESGCSY